MTNVKIKQLKKMIEKINEIRDELDEIWDDEEENHEIIINSTVASDRDKDLTNLALDKFETADELLLKITMQIGMLIDF